MPYDLHSTPLAFFESLLGAFAPLDDSLLDYAAWWQHHGASVVPTPDLASTFTDDNLNAPDVRQLIARGYAAGVVWRAHTQETLLPCFALLYITAYYAPPIARLHAQTLACWQIVDKYAPDGPRERAMARLQAADSPWHGALLFGDTTTPLPLARRDGAKWRLDGVAPRMDTAALVAARVDGTPALFLLMPPSDGDAVLLGEVEDGPALMTEARHLCDMADAIIDVAAILGASAGQANARPDPLRSALALAWAAAQATDYTARELAGVYSDSYHTARLLTLLARHHSHTVAVDVAQATADNLLSRLVGDIVTLLAEDAIRGGLLDDLADDADSETLRALRQQLDTLPATEREATVEPVISALSSIAAQAYMRRFDRLNAALTP
jgi:hypothetical protein